MPKPPKSKTPASLTRYVAFLRGINVGGHTIKMDDLKKAFEGVGVQNVKTLIASGNVLFETEEADRAALTRKIEEKLEKTFGFEIPVLLRSVDELKAMVESEPFKKVKADPTTKFYISFLSEKPTTQLQIPYESPQKDFQIIRVADGAVFSVTFPAKGGRTVDSMAILEKEFGKRITTRNWNTILRLLKGKDPKGF
ncbi:MAG TPA: DUF1697 domain-containing protein [Anaerolineae bacterium]|nr:DUF1697 domain-containing protein [Anaerolineae bacterium]